MIYYMILICILLTLIGCSEADLDNVFPKQEYTLSSGAVVRCRYYEETPCGITLRACDPGNMYTCQTGVGF